MSTLFNVTTPVESAIEPAAVPSFAVKLVTFKFVVFKVPELNVSLPIVHLAKDSSHKKDLSTALPRFIIIPPSKLGAPVKP